MKSSYKWAIASPFFLIISVLISCKTLPKANLANTQQVPHQFEGVTDTLKHNLDWKVLFTDPLLKTVIDTALKNNYDLRIALKRVSVARVNLQMQKAAVLPSVNAEASAGLTKYGDYTIDGVGNYDTNLSPNLNPGQKIPDPVPDYFLGLRSFWELDVWGKMKSRKKAAFVRFLASEKGRQFVVTAVVSQVAQMYYELVALDTELEVLRRNIKLQRTALEMMEIQKEGGQATELAVQQFKAQLLNTQSRELQVQRNQIEVENQLNYLMGRFPQPIARAGSLTSISLPGLVAAGFPSEMLLRRPDIAEAELELRAFKLDINVARKAMYPSLTLSPYLGYNSFKAATLFNTPGSLAYGLLGGLSAPIFNQGILRRNMQRTVVEAEQQLLHYQKTVLNAFMEVTTRLKGTQNLKQQLKVNQEEVDALNKAAEVSQDLFLVGYANYLEIITAQKSIVEAELSLTRTKQQLLASTIDLYRSLGGGWE
ncbi:TolC family protein [Desertivirga arenae]|uniref:TolC family protein n=1 Tax=Desertivirga arenae TaxID=2810309 RepID=UPI001F601C67|nr:TolC family protein [Pedobacter sp. SYSU D00823]